MPVKLQHLTICLLLSSPLLLPACLLTPEPTQYETVESSIEPPIAPPGTPRVKVALINFRNLTNRDFLVSPATAQLTTLMFRSGYFDVIEPSLVDSVIRNQQDITPEKLAILQERFGAQYFLTGTLTNFEIREQKSGWCVLFFLAQRQSREYIVETGIDYRLVSVPDARLLDADSIENRRTDSSGAAHVLFIGGGTETRVLQSSGGQLLRYAMRDLVERMVQRIPRN
ncbi:MAG: hypothetical protein K1X75_00150 [Leptospirales bacterium]|nr:hypothetical protein [Leptospirales bacterium]